LVTLIVRALSGGLGGQIIGALLGETASSGLLGNVAGSGIGGAVLMTIVGYIRKALAK